MRLPREGGFGGLPGLEVVRAQERSRLSTTTAAEVQVLDLARVRGGGRRGRVVARSGLLTPQLVAPRDAAQRQREHGARDGPTVSSPDDAARHNQLRLRSLVSG